MTLFFLLNSNFIWQVETAFREAAITVHILHLSRKKLPIPAVIRQMIVEGVHAVIFLERHHEITARVNMQIFDQSRAARDSNVKYDGMCFAETCVNYHKLCG